MTCGHDHVITGTEQVRIDGQVVENLGAALGIVIELLCEHGRLVSIEKSPRPGTEQDLVEPDA